MSVSNDPPIDPVDPDQDRTRLTARPFAPGTFPSGSMLANTYKIEMLMARGGMGEVYRARHAELGTEHAIKIILPELANNQKVVDLFRREASVLRTIRNDVIVGYDGVFRDDTGRLYLVMEYVDGQSLSTIMRNGPLSSEEVRRLRHRLAIGLAAAHEKGIIHRDLSPDNIIIPGGQIDNAKIIDFGIAKSVEPNARTIIGDDFAGKYSYVSPEQLGMFGGAVDARSDIYSMGLVLAAAAIGEPLDMGMTPISVVEARRSVPNLSRVPADLRDELAALLQPDPRHRVQTMAEVANPGRGTRKKTRTAPVLQSVRSARSRKPLGWTIAALGVLLLLGGAGYIYWVQLPSEQPSPGGQIATLPTPAPSPPPQSPPVAPAPEPGSTATSAPEPPATSAATVAPAITTPPQPPEPAAPAPAPAPNAPTPAPSQNSNADITAPSQPVTLPEVATLTPAVLPPAALSTPQPDLTALKQAAETVASGFSCAKLEVDPSAAGQLVVSGHVSSEQDKARIAMAYGDIAAGRTVVDQVEVQQWPFCEAMGALETQSSYRPGDPVAPQIDLGGRNGTYSEGDKLLVTIRNTPLFDGYLYIDYLDPDGNVLHLLPNPAQPDNHVAAGASVVIGAGPKVYTVSAPFGPQMILAVAAPRPLFEAQRPEVEVAKDYLPALRQSLQAAIAGGYQNSLVGSYGFLRFDPR